MEINPHVFYKKMEDVPINSDDVKLKEQSNAFEALILKNMLDYSLNLEDSLYEKSPGSEIYSSMYKEAIANELSGAFGYGDLLYNYLVEQKTIKSQK